MCSAACWQLTLVNRHCTLHKAKCYVLGLGPDQIPRNAHVHVHIYLELNSPVYQVETLALPCLDLCMCGFQLSQLSSLASSVGGASV